MSGLNRVSVRVTVLLLALVMLFGAAGCGKPAVKSPAAGGIVTLRLGGDPSGFNPLGMTDGSTYQIWAFIAETLVRHTPDNKWTGQLAETWDVSQDGLTYTYHLRKNVKWHDGEPFTADDVMFTWDLWWDSSVNAELQYALMVDGQPTKMEKIDDYTVKLTLPKPYPAILEELAWFIPVPKHILKDVPRKEIATCEWGAKPILTGPFKISEYKPGEYIKLARNDDYWGGKPYLDEVVFRILGDENAATVALESGQLDMSGLSPAGFMKIKTNSKLATTQVGQGSVTVLTFGKNSPNKGLFEDVKVRQALSYLIDRESIANQIMGGLVKPAYNSMVPGDLYYTDEITKREFSVDKAKALLTEAGWTLGADGVLTKGGKRFEVEYMYGTGNPLTEQTALILQSVFGKAGIKLNLRALERTALVQHLYAYDYDIASSSNLLGPDPHRYIYAYGTKSEELAALFAKGQIEVDTVKRAEIYKQIQKILSEQCYDLPVYYPNSLKAYNPKLHIEDAEVNGGVYGFYNPAKIWIEK